MLLYLFVNSAIATTSIPILIPFSPGGPTDRYWRMIEDPLNKELEADGIKLITEYAQGAGGLIAINRIKNANQTVFGFFSSSIAINSTLNANSNYTSKDISFVGYAGSNNMQAVSRFDNLEELKSFCKNNHIVYASGGMGSATHLLAAALIESAGCKNSTHVPYKGILPVIPDAAANRVDVFVDYKQSNTYPTNLKTFPLVVDIQVWHVFISNLKADSDIVNKVQRALHRVKSNRLFLTELENKMQVPDFSQKKSQQWFDLEFDKFRTVIERLKIN